MKKMIRYMAIGLAVITVASYVPSVSAFAEEAAMPVMQQTEDQNITTAEAAAVEENVAAEGEVIQTEQPEGAETGQTLPESMEPPASEEVSQTEGTTGEEDASVPEDLSQSEEPSLPEESSLPEERSVISEEGQEESSEDPEKKGEDIVSEEEEGFVQEQPEKEIPSEETVKDEKETETSERQEKPEVTDREEKISEKADPSDKNEKKEKQEKSLSTKVEASVQINAKALNAKSVKETDADYSAVEAALKKAKAIDRSIYTEKSLAVLDKAVAAVVKNKPASEQKAVNAMAKAIEAAIEGLVLNIKDGNIDLSITNNTAMFKAVSAYVKKKGSSLTLVMELSGSGYHDLFKGTYEETCANGNNPANWIRGYQGKGGRWTFEIPFGVSESYMPCVGISFSYYSEFLKGNNPLERAFFPRQLVVDLKNKTLVTGDYQNSTELQIINDIPDFQPAEAVLSTTGGPNSNSYSSTLALSMKDQEYDKVYLGSAKNAAAAGSERWIAISGKTFTIPARWLTEFGNPESMQTIIGPDVLFSFYSVSKNEWQEKVITINENKGSIKFAPVDGKKPPVDPEEEITPPSPTPQDDKPQGDKPSGDKPSGDKPSGNTPSEDKPSGNEPSEDKPSGDKPAAGSGSTAVVDNSTGLADGVYVPDKFSYSGGTGKIAISCTSVEVNGGMAYATLVFSNTKSGSAEITYVKASGGTYYCSQSGGICTVTIPIELNKNNTILALTTKMSAAHEIAYTIFAYVAGAEEQKGSDLSENKELDTEAPAIAGLEYQDEEEVAHAEFFKIFNYDNGIRLLEVDMRSHEKKEEGNEESVTKDEEKKTETVIDDETGAEVEVTASKADAQAELYKGDIIKYLLVPENVEIPAGLEKETIVIEVPAKSMYAGSDSIRKTMESLHIADRITSQAEEDKNNESVIAAGDYKDLNVKALIKSKCDLALIPNDCIKDEKAKEDFEGLAEDLANLEIPVIVDRAEYEKTNQAKAEWLKVYGILFGCETEADELYASLVK